jgi:TolA-binding protein
MAQLYVANGNTELARTKLQSILTHYPNDPAAIPAKKLLASLPPPSPPPQ